MKADIIDIIINHIKKYYSDDIALFCVYGSYVTGNMHEKSDIDFYFVPKNDRGKELARAFVLDGIGYDLWYLTWDRLNKIVSFDDMFIPLITESKVMWSSSEADLIRFNSLRDEIFDILSKPIDNSMINKAKKYIQNAKINYAELSLDNDADFKLLIGTILINICNAIMIINNSYFKYGTKKHYEELSGLKYLPDNFPKLYYNIINADNYDNSLMLSRELINNTLNMLDNINRKMEIDTTQAMYGFYEEAISTFNKIYHACDTKNSSLAYLSSVSLQNDLNYLTTCSCIKQISLLYRYESNKLAEYKEYVKKAQNQLLETLKKQNIKILEFHSSKDFKNHLKNYK